MAFPPFATSEVSPQKIHFEALLRALLVMHDSSKVSIMRVFHRFCSSLPFVASLPTTKHFEWLELFECAFRIF